MLNLVVNALDSMDDGGTLTIGLAPGRTAAEMVFTDTGCGMTPEVLENIFEPFFTRSRTGKGTGLGLSISHRIITQHGGEIEATSPGPNQGSTFTVRLPLAPAAAVKEDAVGHASPHKPLRDPVRGRRTVAAGVHALRAAAAGPRGHRLPRRPGRPQGAGKEPTFDAAILDLRMPGMTGIEVLEQLKAVSPDTEAVDDDRPRQHGDGHRGRAARRVRLHHQAVQAGRDRSDPAQGRREARPASTRTWP